MLDIVAIITIGKGQNILGARSGKLKVGANIVGEAVLRIDIAYGSTITAGTTASVTGIAMS